jgi:nicotinamidase-related amidase
MRLKFLQPDPNITYIQESLTPLDRLGASHREFYQRGMRPALLIIDLQRGYVSPEPKPWVRGQQAGLQEVVDGAIASVQRLVRIARACAIPVFYTGDRFQADGSDCGIRGEKFPSLKEYMRVGSPWAEIDSRVAPRPGEPIVWKQATSGFFGTYLTPLLIQRNIDTCIITGCATSGCIRATTVDAVSANFRAVVVEDAVCDKNLWAHKASLFDIWRYIATVAPVDEVIAWMESLK